MNAWIHVTGWTIIHFLWQGALLALLTASALHLYSERSSRARYAIACAGLAAMLTVPALTAAVLRTYGALPVSPTHARPQAYAAPESPVPNLATAIEEQPIVPTDADRASVLAVALPYIVWSWVAGVLVLLARFSLGWSRIRRLRGAAERAGDSPWQAAASVLAERLRMTTAFRVVESAVVHAPTVVGWVRPVVLLPVAALTNLSPRQIEALLAHELAHIQRRDYLVNLVQTIAEAFLFFHPCVWWLSSRIRQEREHCCDDVAVAVCGEPFEYAEALLELASWRAVNTALSLGANDGSLLTRIRRLLGDRTDERRPLPAMVTIAAGILLAAGAALSSPAPADAGGAGPQRSLESRSVRHTDHFEIHHDVSLDLHAERVGRDAERAFDQISTDLRHTLAFRVPVILFRTTGDLAASVAGASSDNHTGSFVDRSRDRILIAVDQPPDQWYGTLVHEVTHVFVFDIVPGSATAAWIAEGLAEYEQGVWDPNDLVALRDAVRANAIPPLNDLQQAGKGARSRLVHGVGHAAFDFMESRWGKSGIRQFLLAVRQGVQSGADPFATAFGTRQHEFESAFERYLQQRLARSGAAAAGERADARITLQIEGAVMSLRSPVHAGLACLELWASGATGAPERWALECGQPTPQRLIEALKPGDRVIASGAQRLAATRRMRLDTLVRPADGFTWRR